MDTRQTLRRWLITVICLGFSQLANAQDIRVGQFSSGTLDGWQEKSFVDHTRYQLTDSDRGKVLRADTRNAASGLFKEHTIDLSKTPYLNWSWRADHVFNGTQERSKQGDDYPARIYVVVSGGVFFWRTRAINYVWSSNQAIGSTWNNAYTGNAKMIAMRSGINPDQPWYHEKRDIRADLKQLFGEDIREIHAIAVMSDSDNSGQAATAYYGDIYFSAD